MADSSLDEAIDALAAALKAGPHALARRTGPAASTNFVDRLTTIAHRLEVARSKGSLEVHRAAAIIAGLQRERGEGRGDDWTTTDHDAIGGLEGIRNKLVGLANED